MAYVINELKPTQLNPKHSHPVARRLLGVAAGLSLVAVFAVGCSSSGSPGAASSDTTTASSEGAGGTSGGCENVTNGAVTVVTKNFDFEPNCITMTGDRLKVTYKNEEKGVKHNFDMKSAKSSSGGSATDLKSGPNTQTITYVDLKPGKYDWVCDIHANMKGTLTVKAS